MSVNQIRPTLDEVAQERLRQVDKWGHQDRMDALAAARSERDVAEADLARLREAVLTWADDQMQALPEYRTPVAHGKAELLADLRSVLAQSGERA